MYEDREKLLIRTEKSLQQMRMIDMHAHLSWNGEKEINYRYENRIFTCFSAGTPKEWEDLSPWREREELLMSFGLHPWYADRFLLEDCRDCLADSDFVGEIGMDSVWCEVPLQLQQKVLEQQLREAADQKKPILLHTKGQEQRVGEMIQDFPGKICVHWYSGSEGALEYYLRKDCYFTLGPDIMEVCAGLKDRSDPIQRNGYLRILREVPIQRLFAETDGIAAIAWAANRREAELSEIAPVLLRTVDTAAEQKGYTAQTVLEQMKKNLESFLA